MQNPASFLYLIVFLFVIVIADSCVSHDLEAPPTVDCTDFRTVSFLNDIKPIISNHCAISGCHNGDNGEERNWTEAVKFQDHAFEARRRVQLPISDGDHMPAAGEISNDQIKLIVCWANQGAPINN